MAQKPTGTAAPKKAQDYAQVKDWPGYFSAVLGKPPRDTLLEALARFDQDSPSNPQSQIPNPKSAIDLGCGEGRDTLELLRRNWRVLAIDATPQAFDLLLPRIPAEHRPRLTTQISTFEEARLDPHSCDLLTASFALPFCAPAQFPRVWQNIESAIKPRGRFAGQLFGDRDAWAKLGDRTHHTRSQLNHVFQHFTLEHLREEEKQDESKHWHVFHIVARKR